MKKNALTTYFANRNNNGIDTDTGMKKDVIAKNSVEFVGKNAKTNEISVNKVLDDFLTKHNAIRGVVEPGMVTVVDLLPKSFDPPKVTKFAALHDTFLFARLVSRMVSLAGPKGINTILDMGAGSSVPTIRALLENPNCSAKVIAEDIDPNALAVSRINVNKYQLAGRYEFKEGDMLRVLKKTKIGKNWAVVANPPYLPIPKGTKDPYYRPVDGGPDGIKYLTAILKHPMPAGTYVALEWSSLSNPIYIVSLIEDRYEVLYVQAYDIFYGLYTENLLLKPYLIRQGELGKVALTIGEGGKLGWMFVGTVLRRR